MPLTKKLPIISWNQLTIIYKEKVIKSHLQQNTSFMPSVYEGAPNARWKSWEPQAFFHLNPNHRQYKCTGFGGKNEEQT